ncbi:transcriptional repressor TCF25-domain-containing protein [Phaeosphaeriaceae sp. PMI808]|nr:transcriptional repressor TCF25-domain-containing protein [Phaeosphaeriaceae sp. PMI808]
MSSRALRRAQKEVEEKQLQEQEDEQEQSEEEVAPKYQAKPSLFAMLGDGNEDEDEEEDDDLEQEQPDPKPREDTIATPSGKPKKSKKKKKKGKSKNATADSVKSTANPNDSSGLDEIDQALMALNLAANSQAGADVDQHSSAISEEVNQLCSVLSIDTQHLHAANEMKKLFGRAALQNTDDEARPRQRGGVAAAVEGRNAPGTRNLASLGLRRNIFIQGKEEWPRTTSGGLSMEIVEKRADGTVMYKFVHNHVYQDVQQQFQVCVESMDPERMIQLLHFNPYHISTLLQVSEIAKQQRDNATASELLERALFTFGRSVHSTFSINLAAGKARLDFRYPENREFWLATSRYISTLTVRATWRTALEWARLMLSLDPENDPYCARLFVDQLALRGREPQALVDLVETDYLERLWKVPPNLAFSVALAHDRLKQPQKARSTLRNAIKEYPWLAAWLCKELEISPIPKPVWGKEPNGNYQEILCRLYVPKAKDLWNTTEATSLLVEVCYAFEEELGAGEDPYWLAQIPEIDFARHIILSDDLSLVALLDRRVKSKLTSVSDPLPPEDSIQSCDLSGSGSGSRQQRSHMDRDQLVASHEELRRYFHGIQAENLGEDFTELMLIETLERAGTTIDEFSRNLNHFEMVSMQLQDGGELVFEHNRQSQQQELEVESEDSE